MTTDPFKDVNTTFHASDSALFGSDVDSSDEGKKDEGKEKDESSNEEVETKETTENAE